MTQGTVANHNFGLLIAPTLAALGDEPDVLLVATTGGAGSTKTCSIAASTSRFSAFAASLERDPSTPEIIQTERGVGYVFAGQVERY